VIEPESAIARRQDAPVVYDMTTVAYVARPCFINNHRGVFAGRVKTVIVPDDRAVDIDTIHDFMLAEFILKEKEQ
jgi:CMP-N-acetylneuraminic acid synthetase